MSAALVMVMGFAGSGHGRDVKILVLDDCDASDAGWNASGGCTLKDGAVTLAEFQSHGFFGHPAWRFESSYERVRAGDQIVVRNRGGRRHTFTEVAKFGNGVVPPLNIPGQATVPECQNPAGFPNDLPSGTAIKLAADTPGTHLFQCCFHPWMRAAIKVEEKKDPHDQ
jgi:plastocyanin